MAAHPVARTGDASATAGTGVPTTADSGTWTAGPVDTKTTDLLSSDGRAVLVEASCTFSFSGTKGNSAVADSSKVTLTPGSRTLTAGGVAPLVDGDSTKDDFGNTVKVSSDATAATT